MFIYKQELPDEFGLMIPMYSSAASVEEFKKRVCRIDIQHDVPCMWYLTEGAGEDKANGEEIYGVDIHKFAITAIGTGWPLRQYDNEDGSFVDISDHYLGTCQIDEFVYHYFVDMIE